MNNRPFSSFLSRIIFIGLIASGVIVSFKIFMKISYFAAPFILAFILSILIDPLVRLIMKKTGLNKKVSSMISVLCAFLFIGTVLILIIWRILTEASSAYNSLPVYYQDFYLGFSKLLAKFKNIALMIPDEMKFGTNSVISNLSSKLTSTLQAVLNAIISTFASLPQVILFIITTILSTYFFIIDKDRIINSICNHLPKSFAPVLNKIWNNLFTTLFGYIKAQLILMTITFFELSLGFIIINIRSPLVIALIISLVDSLPILGTGCIMLPWSLYAYLSGNTALSLSLLIIYLIVLILRQLIEPNILSGQIGIHPLITLISIYAGLSLFGIPGLILGPVAMIVTKNIFSVIFKDDVKITC